MERDLLCRCRKKRALVRRKQEKYPGKNEVDTIFKSYNRKQRG